MLPSIGYASTAHPPIRDLSSHNAAMRNDASSKDGSFDQVFASATNDGNGERDRQDGDKLQNSGQTGALQASDQHPIKKQAASGQPLKQPDTQTQNNVGDLLSPGKPASAPQSIVATSAVAVVAPKQERAVSRDTKREEGNEKPAATLFTGLPAGAPLDPSLLPMLLGAGAARNVNVTAETATPANGSESSADAGKEAPLLAGVAPRAQESAATAEAGLAFALRLSRETPAAPASDASVETGRADANPNSFANELGAAAGKAIVESRVRGADENAAGASAAGLSFSDTAAAQPVANAAVESQAKPANAAAAAAPELPAPAQTPLRAVRVELASDNSQRVAVTLVERGGALSISVRSADSSLARSLQEHLPDLSARLTEQRYQTEVWAPRVELPAASAESGESGDRNFGSGGGTQGGHDANSNSGQQQERRDREAPAWFEELAAIGRRPQTRSEYIWVQ